jgi:dihydrofolate reductase
MRRIRYSVATSLDGFIATADGGYDWIPRADDIDFGAFLSKVDTLLMGRGTYETATATEEGRSVFEGREVVVVSTTLDPTGHPDVTVIGGDVEAAVAGLKARPGKDIWLFGGGVLFRALLEAGLVDRVEVAVIPALLGSGVPLLPGVREIAELELHSWEVFDDGIALLKYDVVA